MNYSYMALQIGSALQDWTGEGTPFSKLHVFGQLGRIPNLPITTKFQNRSGLPQYMETDSKKHIRVQLQNGTIKKCAMATSTRLPNKKDPPKTQNHDFASFKQRITVVPTVINPGTAPPVSLTHTFKYPDAARWKIAHDKGQQKVDNEHVVDWHWPVRKGAYPLPLKSSYAYKWRPDGSILERKARFSVLSHVMKPGVHFDPTKIQCPTADKATIRLRFAIAAANGWKIEHMEILNAYVQEEIMLV